MTVPEGSSARWPWSCDTVAVQAQHSGYGATVLGKNSDRPARESQPLRWLPSRRGGRLRLAYVEIDDVEETIAHLGSSPYWCWGHETGVNVQGVAIGNEAVFTRDLAAHVAADRAGKTVVPGILGMELVRLGLERAGNARDAVGVMVALIERYGQYGAGVPGTDRPSGAYDNSYLIADSDEIWVLETSGRRWVTKRVSEPYWALSNEPTIRRDWTECAADLHEHAVENGWCDDARGPIDFARTFQDPQVPLQVSRIRLQRSRTLVREALEAHSVGFMQLRALFSDHYENTFLEGPKFNAARPDFHTLCMHRHPSGFTWGNTASSTIAVLPKSGTPYVWWAAGTPCTSVYVPVAVVDQPLPASLSAAGTQSGAGPNPERVRPDGPEAGSYWWTFQLLLEHVVADDLASGYPVRQPLVRSRFDELQAKWLRDVETVARGPAEGWQALTEACTAEARAVAEELLSELATAENQGA